MSYRSILIACACVLLAAACTKRDDTLAAPAAAPATAGMPAAAPAVESTAAAPAPAGEPEKDRSWAGQVNEAKAVASAQGKAAQDKAATADAVQK